MIDAGSRSHKVTVERATVTRGALGGEVEGVWVTLAVAWAAMRQGTGRERREAAAQGASQPATFVFPRTEVLAGMTEKERIKYRGRIWDIHSIVDSLDESEIEVTATCHNG